MLLHMFHFEIKIKNSRSRKYLIICDDCDLKVSFSPLFSFLNIAVHVVIFSAYVAAAQLGFYMFAGPSHH